LYFLFREIRAVWRLCFVALLVVSGILTVCLIFPILSPGWRRSIKQAWSRCLVRALGVRVRNTQPLPRQGSLIVCNHISWLDVFVLNALNPTTFVCKDDVKSWPGLGTLVSHSGTLFIERGSRSAAARTAQAIAERLNRKECVAVFPEGTTTQGTTLLPFRSALFQAAVEAKTCVMPVALRYLGDDGTITVSPAYDGDLTFMQSMLSIVRSTRIFAQVTYLPALPDSMDRRALALEAENSIARALDLPRGTQGSLPEKTPPTFAELSRDSPDCAEANQPQAGSCINS